MEGLSDLSDLYISGSIYLYPIYLHCKDKTEKIGNKYSQKRNCVASQSQFPHSCVCERFIYSHHRSAYSAAGKYVDWSCAYINHPQTHECEIGIEAAQFLFWEHINGVFVAVCRDLLTECIRCVSPLLLLAMLRRLVSEGADRKITKGRNSELWCRIFRLCKQD